MNVSVCPRIKASRERKKERKKERGGGGEANGGKKKRNDSESWDVGSIGIDFGHAGAAIIAYYIYIRICISTYISECVT
jgi:hypothetical protein